jgi:putative methyltransferase
MKKEKIKISFINPPHADWSLSNNITYLICQSYYNHFGKYPDKFEWLSSPYKWNLYQSVEEVCDLISEADIIMFSSYAWNYSICDEVAKKIKEIFPEKITLLGGPHIGTNDKVFLDARTFYDFICQPTKPGEAFIKDFLDNLVEETLCFENISWELRSNKGTSPEFNTSYSVYEEHFDYLKEMLDFAQENRLEPFTVLETTRGCPYGCVFCEWGGGINTKIIKKDMDLIQRDILALKAAGYRSAYLTDANFGAFEKRDIDIFKFAWENGFHLTDISMLKSRDLEKRKRIVNSLSKIIGGETKAHQKAAAGDDMWKNTYNISIIPSVSIQSISDEAMKIADRVDLSYNDKIELSKFINTKCNEEGYPVPSIELILGMPGSTIEDFYSEMNIVWNFKAWTSFRHDYMFLPDSKLNSEEYKKKYKIETVEVYSDIVDEDGTDNRNSLYQNKKNYFKTIRSCFSFTAEEMHEMWFMNNAANYLLKELYPGLDTLISAKEFCKIAYEVINTIEEFKHIHEEIVDMLDPSTSPKSIRKLNGRFRVDTIEEFIKNNELLIKSEITNRCLLIE